MFGGEPVINFAKTNPCDRIGQIYFIVKLLKTPPPKFFPCRSYFLLRAFPTVLIMLKRILFVLEVLDSLVLSISVSLS